jgi:type IV pilus assembly protein PilM
MADNIGRAAAKDTEAKGYVSKLDESKANFDKVNTIGNNLQSNVDGRLMWLEVLKALDAALPKDERPAEQRQETEEDIARRPELHILSMDCEYYPDLSAWTTHIEQYKHKAPPPPPAEQAADGTTPPADGTTPPAEGATPAPDATAAAQTPPPAPASETPPTAPPAGDSNAVPTGDGTAAPGANGGWVIELKGYHLHNSLDSKDKKVDVGDEGEQFLRQTLIKNLETGTVKLPDGPNGDLIDVPISELGIKNPVVLTGLRTRPVTYMAEPIDPAAAGGMAPGMGPGARAGEFGPQGQGPLAPGQVAPKTFSLRKYNFIVQFSWQPQPRGKRLEKMAEKKSVPAATPEGTEPSTAATGAEPTTTSTGS